MKGSGDETDRSEAVASEPDSELKGSGEKTADPDDANNEGESSTAESDEETLQDGETEDLVESGEDSASLFPARIPAALSSVGDSAVIHSVVLYTYAAQVSGNSVFTACRISSAWSPNAVSYDSLSALSGRLIQTKSISAPGWIGWDLTAAAADWFSSAGNNSAYGVMIRGEGGVGSLDLSSAQAEYPAYYAITYTPFSFEKPKEAEEQETTEEPKKTEEDAKSLEAEELNAAEIEAEDKYLKTTGQLLEEESSTAETVLARAKSIGAGLLGASELCTHSSVSFCYPVSATCTEGGYDFYVCTFCHNAVRLNETPPLGHSYDFAHPVSSNAATCTMASYANYECTRCGNPYSYKVSDALGHDYVYSYSTFSRTRHITHVTCSRCSDVDTTSLDVHVDANDDHVCDCCGFADYPDPAAVTLQVSAHGSGVNSCTGYLDLSWNSVSDATAYYVALFNGEVYEYIPVGNVTSWSTKGNGLWPTQEEIDSGSFRLHTQGGGAELAMIPALSYANAGSEHAGDLYYYVSVIPANAAGYANQPPASTVKSVRLPDTVPPSQASSVSVEPASYTNADTVLLKWEGITDYNAASGSAVSDLGSGTVRYCLDDEEDWLDTGISTGTGSCEIDVSALADGVHALSLRAVDSAGNTGEEKAVQLLIDRTPPSVPEAAITPTDWSNADSAALTWSGIADLTELSRVEYAFDGEDYISTGIAEKEYIGFALDLSSLSDGEHLLRLRAVDLAGNVGEACTLSVLRDTLAPTFGSLTLTPDSWTNGDEAILSWDDLVDANSGVRLVEYRVDDGEAVSLPIESAWSETLDITTLTDGEHTLTVSLEDNAGNRAEHSLRILRDVSLPEIELLSPADGEAANGIVEIWGAAQDLSLDHWQVLAVREDGTEHVLAEGNSEAAAAPPRRSLRHR